MESIYYINPRSNNMTAILPPIEDQKQIISRFRDAIVPTQEIPMLGDKVIANCPPGYGLRLHSAADFQKWKALLEIPSTVGTQRIALFGAEFILPAGAPIKLLQKGRYVQVGLCDGAVSGHMLLSPVPDMKDPRWEKVKFLHGSQMMLYAFATQATSLASFISAYNGEPILRADIAVLENNGDHCDCHIIRDVASL
jgi:hypothetical protein